MKHVTRSFLLVLVAASVLFNARQAQAQSGIEMELSASYVFGEQITFVAQIRSPIQIQSASIVIVDEAQGITHVQPVAFDAAGRSEYRFDVRQNSVHPFANVVWRYDLTMPGGNVVQSPSGAIRYIDDRFTWQTLEADALRVHWYEGGDEFGRAALNAGQAGLRSIGEIIPLDSSKPVDVYIYANAGDLRATLYDSQENWVAGHADSAAGIIMVMVEPNSNYGITMEQRIPHELMHVMLYRQIGAGYRNIPAWLKEGIAVLAEVYPNPDYNIFLTDASARDALIPIRDLCASFSPQIDSAFLAYSEARSFTSYLRGLYGSDGLLDLARAYASGVDCERGPERVFGVSLAKLEMDWRRSVLGQNSVWSGIEGLVPYFALLCLVVAVPFIGIIRAMRMKGDSHGSKPFAR